MKQSMKNKIIDALSSGNRPLRILLFGGIFLAWIIMKVLAAIFGINTDTGDDINLANVVLIIVSILTGFGAAFGIVAYLEKVKQQQEQSE